MGVLMTLLLRRCSSCMCGRFWWDDEVDAGFCSETVAADVEVELVD